MRRLYTLLWWAALPLLPLRLWWRGRREPGYRQHVGERFGRYAAPARAGSYWVHAVSVGETRAAAPLVERIAALGEAAPIVATAMTATGRETARTLYGERVTQAFLPYDLPFAIDAFLDQFKPRAGLLMETELWPNLVSGCARRGMPLYLVNARLSERSARGYARWPSLTQPMLRALAGIAAQTEDDARRFVDLGARDVAVTGNVKFDLDVPAPMRALGQSLRSAWGAHRPVWIAASTRDGEEALVLDALLRDPLPPECLTVIVPRHPQRFDAVAALIAQRGLSCVRRSRGTAVPGDVRIVLGDSMGELLAYYAASDVAFVGGSLMPLGGQNLIEPIAVGTPTLVGPHTFNFAEATERAAECGAARRVSDAQALIGQVRLLLHDAAERSRMVQAANAFHAAHRGAAERTWAWLLEKGFLG